MPPTAESAHALEFLEFWLKAGPSKWFTGGASFDDACRKYEVWRRKGRDGELDSWSQTVSGCLSLIILLDQIPRNIFRGDALQFETDALAIDYCRLAIERSYDICVMAPARAFFYMPLMHSESLADQQLCCDLFRQSDMKDNYHYALIHMDAIARFGRFPHRNKLLGRETTLEEETYLQTGGFGV